MISSQSYRRLCVSSEAKAHPEFTESTVTVSYLEIYNEVPAFGGFLGLLAGVESHVDPALPRRQISSITGQGGGPATSIQAPVGGVGMMALRSQTSRICSEARAYLPLQFGVLEGLRSLVMQPHQKSWEMLCEGQLQEIQNQSHVRSDTPTVSPPYLESGLPLSLTDAFKFFHYL